MSSVDAWYSTTIDIEEVLSNTRQGDFHIFVADVVKSFDTVDRGFLNSVLGRLGLPAWFRRGFLLFPWRGLATVHISHDAKIRLDQRWRYSPRMPFSMFFLQLLSDLGAGFEKSLKGISLNFMRTTSHATLMMSIPSELLPSKTGSNVKVVGQEASPSKCVLWHLWNRPKAANTSWRNESAVELDVCDLGGHVDDTQRARMLGMVFCKYFLQVFMHVTGLPHRLMR